MSILTLASAAVLSAMLFVALWNVVSARRLERAPWRDVLAGKSTARAAVCPRVSLLVPARNEATTLTATLPALLALDYRDLEILVLDDNSNDATAAVVSAHESSAGGRLRLLRGRPLPDGWVGKTWACHQLARCATGDVLVFCDADVTVHADALTATILAMQSGDASALTAFPRQRWPHWTGSAVVPLAAQLPVLTMLPLALVSRLRAPSLSAGNGQWLAFTRDAYRACGGHSAVRGDVIEDIALARRVKASGHRLLPVVSTSLLEVRMYGDAAQLRQGFGRTVYALAGGRPLPFAVAFITFTLAAVYPWAAAAFGLTGALLPLALLAAVRACGVILFRHGIRSALLHPLGSLHLMWIACESFARSRRGTVAWKGRQVRPMRSPTWVSEDAS